MLFRFAVWTGMWLAGASLTTVAAGAESFVEERLANWHQWRGPEASGFAPQGDPPVRWDERTNVKWKAPLPGRGTSSLVVWGERVFVSTAIKTDRQAEAAPEVSADEDREDDKRNDDRGEGRDREKRSRPTHYYQFVLMCLDRATGRILWQRVACEVVPHQKHHDLNSFAAASPVTDGRRVFCSFGSRGVYCYDMDGNLQWEKELGQLEIKFGFGEGSSPALHENVLVVNCDHEGESFITALDATTGDEQWRTPRDENSTWNTPLVTEYGGRTQVIVNGAVRSRSYDLETGELIWEYGEKKGVDAIPSPMPAGDIAICISGLKGDPAYGVPLESMGLLDDDDLAWKHDDGTPQISSGVLVGERLYFTKDRAGIVSCLNARTGEVIINQKRLPGLDDIYASAVACPGRVYFTARNGATTVIDATSDEVRVLAENRLDETIHGSPAIAGRELFIRGEQSLYCLAE